MSFWPEARTEEGLMAVAVPTDGTYDVIILNTLAGGTIDLHTGDLVFVSNVSSTGSDVDLVVLRPEPKK